MNRIVEKRVVRNNINRLFRLYFAFFVITSGFLFVDASPLLCNLSPVSYFKTAARIKSDGAYSSFQEKTHELKEYPTISRAEFLRNLEQIEAILKVVDHSIVLSLDIDDTLISLNKPKIKYLKELLSVLHKSNHLVGVVTHRMIQSSANDPNDFEAFRNSKDYQEIEGLLGQYEMSLDDFDFFSIGVALEDFTLYNYLRIRPSSNSTRFIERSVIIDNTIKVAKIVSLSHIDQAFFDSGSDHFEGAAVIHVDDDGLQGHSLVSLEPIHDSHQDRVGQVQEILVDFEPLKKTLDRIKAFAGIIVPSVRNGQLNFTNVPGARSFDFPFSEDSSREVFDLSTAILNQLQRVVLNRQNGILIPEISSIIVPELTGGLLLFSSSSDVEEAA